VREAIVERALDALWHERRQGEILGDKSRRAADMAAAEGEL